MEIIDSHTHINDIFFGFRIAKPIAEIPFGLVSIREWLGFRRPPGTGTKSGRLLGDIAFVESCRRVQLCEPENYYRHMDRNGIATSILLPIEPNVRTQEVLQISGSYERLKAFASIDFYQSAGDCIEQLHRHMAAGCLGLKIHPVLQFVRPDSEKLLRVLGEYERYGKPVCIHAGPCRAAIAETDSESYTSAEFIGVLLKRFPKINFIVAHMGHEYFPEFFDLARTCANVYFDTSFQPASVLRKALSIVGEDRIVFGSDFPLVSQSSVLRVVRKAYGDRSTVLEKVLAKNIKVLCGL